MATNASVFADLQGLPTSLGEGVVYDEMKPLSKGVDLPASQSDRKFKNIYTGKKAQTMKLGEGDEGFTIFISLEYSESFDPLLSSVAGGIEKQRTPKVFIKCTIGKTPTYSFYFGEDAHSYNFMPPAILVVGMEINQHLQKCVIKLSDGGRMGVNKGHFTFSWADESATHGFALNDVKGHDLCFMAIAPYNTETVTVFKTAMKKQEEGNVSALGEAIKKLLDRGEGIYMWNADKAKVHFSAQSFTFNEEVDKKFLILPSVDFEGKKPLNTKEKYIRFNCVIENPTLRTDNYTGYDPADPSIYLTTLQFPGDEALLAPIGTSKEGTEAACGQDSPQGRVLKSIIPAMNVAGTAVQEVKLEFHDGSEYRFPNAETGLFTAKDKETGQELQGRVDNLIIAEGSWKEAHATEVVNRLERNTKPAFNLTKGDKNLTSAIAWETPNGEIKVIVPTEKGSKLITIPLSEA